MRTGYILTSRGLDDAISSDDNENTLLVFSSVSHAEAYAWDASLQGKLIIRKVHVVLADEGGGVEEKVDEFGWDRQPSLPFPSVPIYCSQQ